MTVRGFVAAPRRLTGISACRRRKTRGARWRGSLSLSEAETFLRFYAHAAFSESPLDYVKFPPNRISAGRILRHRARASRRVPPGPGPHAHPAPTGQRHSAALTPTTDVVSKSSLRIFRTLKPFASPDALQLDRNPDHNEAGGAHSLCKRLRSTYRWFCGR